MIKLGISTPVLLQQILRAMENPASSRRDAITFTVLSLLLRLVATQSGVFNTWFSRRCYERSRGEMITMIFEKTLSRKIIGSPKKLITDDPVNGGEDGIMAGPGGLKSRFRVTVNSIFQQIKKFTGFAKTIEDVKQPASMGKILNLMR